ncbi:hypothetical protein SAMN05880501_11439 [Ureibacillus xyleni]|uniref:Uncharacterized protein n=1 Tax=Ureibacillus xyleni TaxID=614648 RepID=A0A285TJT9_9BACL|nr:hypothetical protein [Ureibacillus xyleni]SOC22517.1 hypothetical protein SAMN05880501_11439 [Ureibacillus xyleni]
MSNSDAKKKRLKLLRQQGKDVTISRGNVSFSMHERKTKTKLETLEKKDKKYKKQFLDE